MNSPAPSPPVPLRDDEPPACPGVIGLWALCSAGRPQDDDLVVGTRWWEQGGTMRANVGDELVVRGHHVGDENREAVIIEVHGEEGTPPYLVRWRDGHESVFFHSSDTTVKHHPCGSKPGSRTP